MHKVSSCLWCGLKDITNSDCTLNIIHFYRFNVLLFLFRVINILYMVMTELLQYISRTLLCCSIFIHPSFISLLLILLCGLVWFYAYHYHICLQISAYGLWEWLMNLSFLFSMLFYFTDIKICIYLCTFLFIYYYYYHALGALNISFY